MRCASRGTLPAVPCKFTELVIDSADPRRLADFWAAVLGYTILDASDEGVEIGAGAGTQPTLVFVPVPESKTVKNRVHIDVNPSHGSDQQTELQRLIDLGAKHADIGQRDVGWHVLADPEGNEFCLLKSTVD
jgi:catechol-2,3-dioxygenase